MDVSLLIAEAVVVTTCLATRTDAIALHAVAGTAEEAIGGKRARPANECPLDDVVRFVPSDTHPDTASLVDAFRSGLDELTWFRNDAVPSDL